MTTHLRLSKYNQKLKIMLVSDIGRVRGKGDKSPKFNAKISIALQKSNVLQSAVRSIVISVTYNNFKYIQCVLTENKK